MHTTEHTDLDGDALTIHRDKGLAWITLTRGGEEMTVGPVHADVLEARGGHSRRSDVDPVPIVNEVARLDGELHETRNRAEEAEDTLSLVQQQRDQAVGRVNALSDGNDALRARAKTAERERDETRDAWEGAVESLKEANALINDLRAAESRPLTPDAITERMVMRAAAVLGKYGYRPTPETVRRALDAALAPEPPQRPDWLDAPAVRAWHKNDGRTEHDGTPGKPRIWSPDYGTTETWSTPSLREVPWTDLVDVEPLDVSAELAEGLDRVAEFMSTGMVRAREDGAA